MSIRLKRFVIMTIFSKIPNPKRLLLTALKQGWDENSLAWASAWGFAVGLFPIYGVTTVTLAGIGWVWKLNHAVLQGFNYLVSPLKMILILPYVALGETLFGAERRFSLSLAEFTAMFQQDPLLTLRQFGMTFVHAISGWLATFPLLMLGMYGVTRYLFHVRRRIVHIPRESVS